MKGSKMNGSNISKITGHWGKMKGSMSKGSKMKGSKISDKMNGSKMMGSKMKGSKMQGRKMKGGKIRWETINNKVQRGTLHKRSRI